MAPEDDDPPLPLLACPDAVLLLPPEAPDVPDTSVPLLGLLPLSAALVALEVPEVPPDTGMSLLAPADVAARLLLPPAWLEEATCRDEPPPADVVDPPDEPDAPDDGLVPLPLPPPDEDEASSPLVPEQAVALMVAITIRTRETERKRISGTPCRLMRHHRAASGVTVALHAAPNQLKPAGWGHYHCG